MAILKRGNVNIYYEVHGSGPAVLLTSGYSATTTMWKPNLEALAQRYQLILWDMRGHGQSDSPNDPYAYTEDLTVGDMDHLLDACDAKQAVIGGLSLGGYMSLAYHLLHPERTSALMLLDTGPGYKKDAARAGWNKRAQATAREYETKGLEALGRSAEVLASNHRSAQGLAHAARGMLAQRDARVINSLESVKVPTLVLAGAKDEPFLAATDYMAGKIPGAAKVLIPDAGHAANIDQPEAFNQAVLEFLVRAGM